MKKQEMEKLGFKILQFRPGNVSVIITRMLGWNRHVERMREILNIGIQKSELENFTRKVPVIRVFRCRLEDVLKRSQ
jgi:hypothetical protein